MNPDRMQKQFFRRLGDAGMVCRLFETLPDVYFFVKNSKGQIVAANANFAKRMGGKEERDIIGKTGFDLCPEELARKYEADDQQVMQTGKALINRIELNQDSDGSVDWLVTNKIPLYGKNGKTIGIAGVARNVKEADIFFQPYDRLAKVIQLISKEFNRNINVAELAAMVHMSLSQFERKFRKVFRMSPRQYIMNTRINNACVKMGDSSKSLTEIALEVGFYDHSAFTKQFVGYMGMTPKAYRKKFMPSSE
ncbi:MAG: AraC family transcriptional regulator [Kiritimatiellae bacterium]|nr:AraC family transcriptional regulator [Kiritimatiellia bacterium]MDD5522332.1 AraC family transcriptional regulator [Kiritimatiellia bacterium]